MAAGQRKARDAMVPPVSAIPSTSVIAPSGGATPLGTEGDLDTAASDPVGVTQVRYELTGEA
jgi:hypothetical protein